MGDSHVPSPRRGHVSAAGMAFLLSTLGRIIQGQGGGWAHPSSGVEGTRVPADTEFSCRL